MARLSRSGKQKNSTKESTLDLLWIKAITLLSFLYRFSSPGVVLQQRRIRWSSQKRDKCSATAGEIRNLVTAKLLKRFLHLWTQDFVLQNSPCFFLPTLRKPAWAVKGFWSRVSVLTESGKKGRCFFSPHTSFAPCKTDFEKKILTVLQCIKRLDPFRISLCCLNEAFSTSIADHGIFVVNSHFRDLYSS